MAKKDYYNILGIQKNATSEEIKKAFRKLAMQHHPDRNSGDKSAEVKFKELNEAYEILKDDQKRAAYDRYGHSAFEHGGMNDARSGQSSRSTHTNADFADFSDIFSSIFGSTTSHTATKEHLRGNDLSYELEITLEEAFLGTKQNIKYKAASTCTTCKGSGSKSGKGTVVCSGCKGTGRMRKQQGFFAVELTCTMCGGSGSTLKDPCETCYGEGRILKVRTVSVNIPAGIDTNNRVRITGEGEAGIRGGASGDLYVFTKIKPHPLFTREGANLHATIPVKMTTAALGGQLEIPGIDSTLIRVTIPQGAQNGMELRIRGKGMPSLKNSISHNLGDLLIKLHVETPVKLTEKQKAILEELDRELSDSSSPQTTGFFTKIKNFWNDITK